jgi:hypothetical protein
MSTPDAPIPKSFWGAVHWTLQNHPWIFFLVAIERLAERDFVLGAVFAAIFVADLFVASRWDEIGGYLQRRKSMLPHLALGAPGLLFLGISIGVLWSKGASLTISVAGNTGRIIWNFDQMAAGQANFLNLSRLNQDEIRVVGFGAHGRNTSTDPISEFKGYVRSDLTNARLPILIAAEDPSAPAVPNPFQPAMIPTKPEETFGIPALAEFDIVTFEGADINTGVDGVPVSQFLREFGSFTLVLEYDGLKIEQKFPADQIRKAIDKFEKDITPKRTTAPRVTRRPDASSPRQSLLPLQLPPASPPPTPSTNDASPPSTGSTK